jgi:DNA polymerase-3 subunit beta
MNPCEPRCSGIPARFRLPLASGEAKIAFNGKYLTDVLSVLRESRVALEATSPSSPGVIRPVGVDNYVHVVMPMFVQW